LGAASGREEGLVAERRMNKADEALPAVLMGARSSREGRSWETVGAGDTFSSLEWLTGSG
jgi:hypothetical protein